jgi:hypothetical protein
MNATIEHNFKYHPPTGKAIEAQAAVRAKAKELALLIDELLPPAAGREKALAITSCEQTMMFACAGIARHMNTPAPPLTDVAPQKDGLKD